MKLTIKCIALLEQLYFTYYNTKPKKAQKAPHRVQTWLGYHIWTIKTQSQDSQIHFFFHFSHDVLYFTLFLKMSNEIILFQILCRPLKYLLFSLIEVGIIKFIQCGPCSINGPKFPKNSLFETFYIIIVHLVLSHSCILYTLAHKVFVVKSWAK